MCRVALNRRNGDRLVGDSWTRLISIKALIAKRRICWQYPAAGNSPAVISLKDRFGGKEVVLV